MLWCVGACANAMQCCRVLLCFDIPRAACCETISSEAFVLSADCRELEMLLEFDATVVCAEWCDGLTRSGRWMQCCCVVSVAMFDAVTI